MRKTIVIIASAALGFAAAGLGMASEDLAKKSGCMGCHDVAKKKAGPAFKDVAAKYKGNAGAADMLAAKIIKGGSGVWGPVPMPANTQVSEADAKKLAAWVLTAR